MQTIYDSDDGIGVMVVDAIDTNQKGLFCDMRVLNDALPLFSLSAGWVKLVFDNPVALFLLTQELQDELALCIEKSAAAPST